MNLFGHFASSSSAQAQKKKRPMITTNESVEVIRCLALEVKYSEEITMFMFTLFVLFGTTVCKRRSLSVFYNDSRTSGCTVI